VGELRQLLFCGSGCKFMSWQLPQNVSAHESNASVTGIDGVGDGVGPVGTGVGEPAAAQRRDDDPEL